MTERMTEQTDYPTTLINRTLGLIPVLQPLIASYFAPLPEGETLDRLSPGLFSPVLFPPASVAQPAESIPLPSVRSALTEISAAESPSPAVPRSDRPLEISAPAAWNLAQPSTDLTRTGISSDRGSYELPNKRSSNLPDELLDESLNALTDESLTSTPFQPSISPSAEGVLNHVVQPLFNTEKSPKSFPQSDTSFSETLSFSISALPPASTPKIIPPDSTIRLSFLDERTNFATLVPSTQLTELSSTLPPELAISSPAGHQSGEPIAQSRQPLQQSQQPLQRSQTSSLLPSQSDLQVEPNSILQTSSLQTSSLQTSSLQTSLPSSAAQPAQIDLGLPLSRSRSSVQSNLLPLMLPEPSQSPNPEFPAVAPLRSTDPSVHQPAYPSEPPIAPSPQLRALQPLLLKQQPDSPSSPADAAFAQVPPDSVKPPILPSVPLSPSVQSLPPPQFAAASPPAILPQLRTVMPSASSTESIQRITPQLTSSAAVALFSPSQTNSDLRSTARSPLSPPSALRRSPASVQSSLPPTVQVTIGRVEVRGVKAPTVPPRGSRADRQPTSLSDYLKQREDRL